jgi:hypothetical protein
MTLALLLLASLLPRAGGEEYADAYPSGCRDALAFYAANDALFEAAARGTSFSPRFLFAIVAPEYTRYSGARDKIESYSLKVLYVQGGASYSDFSVGPFQMKPSFVERLEASIAADSLLAARHAGCLLGHLDARAARVERLRRLASVEWQLEYLVASLEIVERRFASLASADDEEKLRFHATAYNCGFHVPEQRIREMERKAYFPRSTRRFRYSDVAAWFYRITNAS